MSSGKLMVQFEHVWKRYSRRAHGSSLRDTIPAIASKILRPANVSVSVETGDFWALRNVGFDVREGEVLGIIGPNGAGKSTILKLLAGVTAPTRGHARVNGRFSALIELAAGFHPDLTGRENVYLNGSILGLKRTEITRKLDSIVAFAGLDQFIDTPVKHYSSGMIARLGFAIAAHVEPEVLLIDEVLSVGDMAFQAKCLKKMEEYRNNGSAIVFVSHNLSAIAALCSKVVVLRAGEAVTCASPKEAMEVYTNLAHAVMTADEAALAQDHIEGRVSHDMRVVAADMFDADGRLSCSFSSGDTVTLVVRARADRNVREPIVGISLRDANGTTVYGTNTAMQKVHTGFVSAGAEIVVTYELSLNICDGTYSVTAAVDPSDGVITMDWRNNILSFRVVGTKAGLGIADLRAVVSSVVSQTASVDEISGTIGNTAK